MKNVNNDGWQWKLDAIQNLTSIFVQLNDFDQGDHSKKVFETVSYLSNH